MNICVIGAGPGAMAMACRLIEAGHAAGLAELPRFSHNIEDFQDDNSIQATGMIDGRFDLAFAGVLSEDHLRWARVVMVVTHAGAHGEIADICARYPADGRQVILCPGYVGGGWHFNRRMKGVSLNRSIPVTECSVLPFACRKPNGRTVSIHGVKRRFMVSAVDAGASQPAFKLLDSLFTGMMPSDHPLEAGLNETNFVLHAVIALLNVGHVQGGVPWTFYRQGLTEAVGRLVEAVDGERLALMERMSLRPIPLGRWLLDFYGDQGMKGETVYDVMSTFPPFAQSPGPLSLTHRYFSEDIPFGLVPMSSLGKKCGLPMDKTDALIELAGSVCAHDFRDSGRDLSPFDGRHCAGSE